MYIKTDYEITEWEAISKLGKKFIKKHRRKIYHMKCDCCNEKFTQRSWYPKNRLNNKVKHFCSECYAPALGADLGRETARQNRLKKVGEKKIDSMGYPTIYVGEYYSYSSYCGRIREHVFVMEEHLKRALRRTGVKDGNSEAVHHIDGDKTNNKLSNLQVMTQTEHNRCHAGNDALIMKLYRKGIVGYNRRKKKYFCIENL